MFDFFPWDFFSESDILKVVNGQAYFITHFYQRIMSNMMKYKIDKLTDNKSDDVIKRIGIWCIKIVSF